MDEKPFFAAIGRLTHDYQATVRIESGPIEFVVPAGTLCAKREEGDEWFIADGSFMRGSPHRTLLNGVALQDSQVTREKAQAASRPKP